MRHSRTFSIAGRGRGASEPSLGSTVFGLFFAGFAIFMMSLIVRSDARDSAIGKWGSVPCVVEKSGVTRNHDKYVLNVDFRYAVDGKDYTANAFRRNGSGYSFDSISKRAGLLERYAVGTGHECHVNPDNPREAFLDAPESRHAAMSVFPYLFILPFVIVGLSVAFGPWVARARRRRREAQGAIPGVSAPKKSANSWVAGVFLIAFGSVFTLPAVLSGFVTFNPHKYDSWQPVDAVILYSEVISHTSHRAKGGSSTTYHPYIAYSYTVNGVDYENDRLSPRRVSDQDRSFHAETAARYPVGSHATAYYNPDDPADSLLERKGRLPLVVTLVASIFALVGIGVACGGVAMTVKCIRKARRDAAGGIARDSGPRRLRRTTVAGCCALTFFALFWCGLTSCFVLAMKPWKATNLGLGDIMPLAIMVVFSCVGLWLLTRAVIEWVRNFSGPHLVLTLADGSAEPGRTVQVAYEIAGDAASVENFTVSLVGGRRQTNDLSQIGNPRDGVEVFKVEGGMVPQQGYFRITVPEAGMDLFVRGRARGHLEMRDRYDLSDD